MKLEQVKNELKTQKGIREEKARISGPVTLPLENLLDESVNHLASLGDTPEGKVNEVAIRQLATELEINDKELEENFNDGLRYNIKAAYKIGLLDKDSSPEDIKHIIGAYTLSFRSALNNFKKSNKKETSSNVLKISKRMYLLPPTILKDLREKYKDNDLVEDWMIKHFVIHNPSNPEVAIERTLTLILELKEKYKDVDDWVIKHFAVSNPLDAETAIERTLTLISELKEKYPSVDEGMIKQFAVSRPLKSEAAIERTLEIISYLKKKYWVGAGIDGPEANVF